MPGLGGKDIQNVADRSVLNLTEHVSQTSMDFDIKALALYRCHYCSFSSADVPGLMLHFKTDHESAEVSYKN